MGNDENIQMLEMYPPPVLSTSNPKLLNRVHVCVGVCAHVCVCTRVHAFVLLVYNNPSLILLLLSLLVSFYSSGSRLSPAWQVQLWVSCAGPEEVADAGAVLGASFLTRLDCGCLSVDTHTQLLLVAGKEPKIFTSAPLYRLSPQGDS